MDDMSTYYLPKTPQKSVGSLSPCFLQRGAPLTPTPTPTRGTKRLSTSESEHSLDTPCSKRRTRSLQYPSKSPFRKDSIPKFSILYNQRAVSTNKISAIELKRASESILRQVDWDEVEDYVASNRRGSTFRKAIKDVLQDRVDELHETESSSSPSPSRID